MEELNENISKRAKELAEQFSQEEKSESTDLVKVELENKSLSIDKDRNIVKESENQVLDDIKNSEGFQKDAQKLYELKVHSQAEEELIKIKDKDIQNEYEKYLLVKKKQLLDTRVKEEKNLVVEEVRADIQKRKIEIAKKRYGYLTPMYDKDGNVKYDENGEIVVDMSKFTPNKTSNWFKELVFNYLSINQSTRKVIGGTVKTLLIIGGVVLGGFLIWKLGKFILPILTKLS